jgi:hypothetical protein
VESLILCTIFGNYEAAQSKVGMQTATEASWRCNDWRCYGCIGLRLLPHETIATEDGTRMDLSSFLELVDTPHKVAKVMGALQGGNMNGSDGVCYQNKRAFAKWLGCIILLAH